MTVAVTLWSARMEPSHVGSLFWPLPSFEMRKDVPKGAAQAVWVLPKNMGASSAAGPG